MVLGRTLPELLVKGFGAYLRGARSHLYLRGSETCFQWEGEAGYLKISTCRRRSDGSFSAKGGSGATFFQRWQETSLWRLIVGPRAPYLHVVERLPRFKANTVTRPPPFLRQWLLAFDVPRPSLLLIFLSSLFLVFSRRFVCLSSGTTRSRVFEIGGRWLGLVLSVPLEVKLTSASARFASSCWVLSLNYDLTLSPFFFGGLERDCERRRHCDQSGECLLHIGRQKCGFFFFFLICFVGGNSFDDIVEGDVNYRFHYYILRLFSFLTWTCVDYFLQFLREY